MTAPESSQNVSVESRLRKYRKKSQFRTIWNRLKKNRLAIFGLVLFTLMLGVVATADLYYSYEQDAVAQNLRLRFKSPGKVPGHPLGTDQYGRDVLARVIYGGRISMFVGLATICVSLSLGSLIGATAAYYGGKVDNILMRIMDVFLAIPNILMAITLVAAFGTSLFNLILAMGLAGTPKMSRIVRSAVLSIIGTDYIEAARACGTSDMRIIFRHILPNAVGPIVVQATIGMATTILGVAGLSFIGLGIEAPLPEWGSMLSEAKSQMMYQPYLMFFPGIAIVLAVLALNLIGDGLRDALDPRMKT